VLVAVAAIASALVADWIFATPTRIDRISFENSTDFHVSVEVSGERRGGWTALGTARAMQNTTVADVLDVGEVWVFRFSSQGRDGGELRVSRSALAGNGWRVEI
jgi:hypothetical protein